jgi:predicted phage tail protein
MYIFLSGALLLAAIIGVFWLKDELESPFLARLAYSGLVARLAVAGAAISLVGFLLMIAEAAEYFFG